MNARLTLAAALAFTCLHIHAQTYYPMPTDSATWTVVEYGYGTIPPETGVSHFGIWGDTLIHSHTYHKIYANTGALGAVNPDPAFNILTATLYGAFREDSSKKVWFRRVPLDTIDILVYDFALNPGDTFCFNNEPCGVQCHQVASVDSILVNGTYRRQIHFTYGSQEEAWIEGIGSKYDKWIGNWCFAGNIAWFLNCYREKDIPVYGTCDYPTGTDEATGISSNWNMYPNPVSEYLTIEHASAGATLTLENMTGERVYTEKLTSDKSQISVAFLADGIYLLRCRGKEYESVRKLLKQ